MLVKEHGIEVNEWSRVYGAGSDGIPLFQARLWVLVSSFAFDVVSALLIALGGKVLGY